MLAKAVKVQAYFPDDKGTLQLVDVELPPGTALNYRKLNVEAFIEKLKEQHNKGLK